MLLQRVVQAFQIIGNGIHGVGRDALAVAVGDIAVHVLGQMQCRLAHARKGLFLAVHVSHFQAQQGFVEGCLFQVFGQRGLRVVLEAEQRRRAFDRCRQHQAAWQHAGHETVAGSTLLQVTGAPGGLARTQHEAQARVVGAGELVQFAGTGHFFEHFGEMRRAVDGIGHGLGLEREFGKGDLVERTAAVGQLHTGLELVVELPGNRRLPQAAVAVAAFHGERLGIDATGSGQCRLGRLARNHGALIQHDGGHGIQQRIKQQLAVGAGIKADFLGDGIGFAVFRSGPAICRRVIWRCIVLPCQLGAGPRRQHVSGLQGGIHAIGFGHGGAGLRCRIGPARLALARLPGVVGDQSGQNQGACSGQSDL